MKADFVSATHSCTLYGGPLLKYLFWYIFWNYYNECERPLMASPNVWIETKRGKTNIISFRCLRQLLSFCLLQHSQHITDDNIEIENYRRINQHARWHVALFYFLFFFLLSFVFNFILIFFLSLFPSLITFSEALSTARARNLKFVLNWTFKFSLLKILLLHPL